MAKIYEIAFQLAGKLGSNFGSTFLSAQKHISGLDSQIKKLKADMKSGGNKTELQAQIAGLTVQKAKFTAAQGAADKFKSSVSSAFKSAAITAGVATTAVGAYYAGAMKLANGVMEHAKHAQVAASIAGTSAQWYEKMSYAAKSAGVSAENFDKSLGKMAINLGQAKQGNKEMTATFAKLGISANEIKNMKPEEAFLRITKGLNGVTDAAVRTDLARKVFGKVGTSMIPLAKMSAEQIQALEKEAQRMGVVLNNSALEQAKAYRLAKNKFDAVWSGTKLGIGQAIMPGLASGMETISKLAVKYQPAIRNFAKGLGNGIKEATPEILKTVQSMGKLASTAYNGAKAFSNLIGGFHNLVYVGAGWIGLKMAVSIFSTGRAMVSAGSDALKLVSHMKNLHIMMALTSAKMKLVSIATKAWAIAQGVLNAVMSANPIALVVVAAIALGAAAIYVYKNWDTIKAYFSDWSGVTAAISGFIDGVKNLFMPLFNWISDKWNAVKNAFSSMPTGSGDSGAPDVSGLPGHASGGIFNREHIARFAEGNKPEATMALDGSSRSKNIWLTAGQALGMIGDHKGSGQRSGQRHGVDSRGGSSPISITQVFHISGGNRAEVESGVNQANNVLLRKLQSLQQNEERLSYG